MSSRIIKKFRKIRSEKLSGIGKNLSNIGITANLLTFLGLISGLLAIYFLFSNHLLFVIFTAIHFLSDSFDGVVARISKTTKFGKYFDLTSDSLITLLAIIKTGWYLDNYYVYIAAGLFLVALLIHFRSKLKAPILFMRTPVLFTLIIATHQQFQFTRGLLTIGYLTAGLASLYSLFMQIRWMRKS